MFYAKIISISFFLKLTYISKNGRTITHQGEIRFGDRFTVPYLTLMPKETKSSLRKVVIMKKTVIATLTTFATVIILLVAMLGHQSMPSKPIRVTPGEPFGSTIISRTNGTVEVHRNPCTNEIEVYTVVAGDGVNHGDFTSIVQDAIESGNSHPEP